MKDVFTKFGGHPMAAGVSLPVDRVDELRQRLNANCKLTEDDMQEVIKIDCDMPLSYISEELIDQLDLLAPFGTGNSKPLFALKDIKINRLSYMGKEGQYLRLNLETETGGSMTGLMFRGVEELENRMIEKYDESTWQTLFSTGVQDARIDIIYEPSVNEFRGNRSLQVIIENFK